MRSPPVESPRSAPTGTSPATSPSATPPKSQARTVLRVAAGHRLYALYVFGLCLGLRRGELLGLRWVDVDLDGEKLEVVQALQRVGGRLRFVKPKDPGDSERTVPLPRFCVEALREHKKAQFAERSEAWPDWDDHGLAFCSRRGTPMEPDNLRRSWGTIREEAGLGETRFHDLRHTCVTLLLDLGIPPHVVREIVGHSDIEVTMTIYAHVSLDEKRKALGKLGDVLGPRPLSSALSSKRPDRDHGPGILAGQWWWSGAGSNCRPSAFQLNRAERCADLQKRTSLTSETALSGRCNVHASRTRCTPSTRQDSDPTRATATVVGVIMAASQSVRDGCPGDLPTPRATRRIPASQQLSGERRQLARHYPAVAQRHARVADPYPDRTDRRTLAAK